MIKPGSIKIIGTESAVKYIVQYYEDEPQEFTVNRTVAKLIWAAVEQGKREIRDELKRILEG